MSILVYARDFLWLKKVQQLLHPFSSLHVWKQYGAKLYSMRPKCLSSGFFMWCETFSLFYLRLMSLKNSKHIFRENTSSWR